MLTFVVGRDAELASLHDFVKRIMAGSAALVLEGEAGMGKTTLWRAGVEAAEAAGLRVLQAEPAESETALSFSGLGDLLDRVLDEALAPLPVGQRSALARALVLEEAEGPAPDAHAAGVALLNALRALASDRQLLVAVDDVQWLDAATSAALAYAARRLRSEHIGVLIARRAGLESSLLDELRRSSRTEQYRELDVGPLDLAPLHEVVHAQLGITLPRPLLAEVHQASGGNPFYALEIVRTLTRSGVSAAAGRPLPVPDSLHDLVHGRLLALPPESLDFLPPPPPMPIRRSRSPRRHPAWGEPPASSRLSRLASSRPKAIGSASPTRCSPQAPLRRQIRGAVQRFTRASPSCSTIRGAGLATRGVDRRAGQRGCRCS